MLFGSSTALVGDSRSLADLGVIDGDRLKLCARPNDANVKSANFFAPDYDPIISQSQSGLSLLGALLRVLKERDLITDKFLSFVLSITSFPPAVVAMQRLCQSEKLSLLDKMLIGEALFAISLTVRSRLLILCPLPQPLPPPPSLLCPHCSCVWLAHTALVPHVQYFKEDESIRQGDLFSNCRLVLAALVSGPTDGGACLAPAQVGTVRSLQLSCAATPGSALVDPVHVTGHDRHKGTQRLAYYRRVGCRYL